MAIRGAPERLRSVDALRGADVALMIFVNHVGGMKNVPAWTEHLPSSVDGYTLTDMVFPWFLFIAGVAIPFSLGKYLAGPAPWRALLRIVPRVLSLVVLGVMFVNQDAYDPAATGMTERVWMTLFLGAAVALWSGWPGTPGPVRRRVETAIKAAAALLMAWLIVRWRGLDHGTPVPHMTPQWWGILGIIGWAYLVGSLTFLLVRGHLTALMGLLGLMTAIAIGSQHDRLGILSPLDRWLSVHEYLGSTTGLVVAGTIAGVRLGGPGKGRVRFLALFGLGLWAAGWFLRPLHGYHKNSATESWALVAAGQASLLLAAAHAWFDSPKAGDRGGWLFAWAGRNALFAYILPDLLGALAGLAGVDLMPWWGRGGAWGMANAAALSLGVVAIAAVSARRGFVVRL